MTDEQDKPTIGEEWHKWHSDPQLWEKLKPLAREKRNEQTPAEYHLWQAIRNRQLEGAKFRRQHTIERFIADFFCAEAKLVIELDGAIHQYTTVEDSVRQEFLESIGLRVLRFTNEEVLSQLESVIARISVTLHEM